MNCSDYLDRLDDALCGRLAAGAAAAMDEHRRACADCRDAHRAAAELRLRVRQLARSIEPPHDLWPRLADRLADTEAARPGARRWWGASRRTWWQLAAAAAVLLAVVTVSSSLGRRQQSTRAQAPPAGEAAVVAVDFEQSAVADLERQVEIVRRQLLEVIASQDLDPETSAVVMENLGVIREAARRIDRALAEDPGNPRLTRQLAFAHRQELDLLRRVARLPADV